MKEIEAFPATWFRCPNCRVDNTFRYNLCESRRPNTTCHGCGKVWDFDSMARATFAKFGFEPFPNEHFRVATDFICEECGKDNTVLNPITNQELKEASEGSNGMCMATQEIEDVDEAECLFCGTHYSLKMEVPQPPDEENHAVNN